MLTPKGTVSAALAASALADASLGSPSGGYVALIQQPFTPSPNLALLDLTLADFDGSTPLKSGADVPNFSLDPLTGNYWGTVVAPAGGWYWEVSGATNLQQTIYGFAFLDHDKAVLIAAELLPTPVTLHVVSESITIFTVRFQLSSRFLG